MEAVWAYLVSFKNVKIKSFDTYIAPKLKTKQKYKKIYTTK